MGAELKIRRYFLAASRANLKGPVLERSRGSLTGFIADPATTTAFEEALSPLDWEEGDKKEAHVMVQALEPG